MNNTAAVVSGAREALSASTVVTEVTDYLAAGGTKTIGALVFWSLAGVNIPRGELRKVFGDAGLGAAVPREPKPTTLLTTAVQSVMVGQRDLVARRYGKGWAILLEERDTERDVLKHTQILTANVTLAPTKSGLPLEWKGRGTQKQLARAAVVHGAIEQAYVETRDFLNTSDLSAILVNLMHGTSRDTLISAVSLRQTSGGLYFVHSRRLEDMRLVKNTLERMAPKSTINVMTLMGNADNLAQAAASARTSFESQLKEIRTEVQAFVGQLSQEGAVATDRNLDVRAARYAQLKARVELFSDVLGDIAGELTADIEVAQAELVKALES